MLQTMSFPRPQERFLNVLKTAFYLFLIPSPTVLSYDFQLLILLKIFFIAKTRLKDKISAISQRMLTSLVILNSMFWYIVITTVNFKPPLCLEQLPQTFKCNQRKGSWPPNHKTLPSSCTQKSSNIHCNEPCPHLIDEHHNEKRSNFF